MARLALLCDSTIFTGKFGGIGIHVDYTLDLSSGAQNRIYFGGGLGLGGVKLFCGDKQNLNGQNVSR